MPFMSSGSSIVSREAEKPSVCRRAKTIKTLAINFMASSSSILNIDFKAHSNTKAIKDRMLIQQGPVKSPLK
jgi:hypothetical protein